MKRRTILLSSSDLLVRAAGLLLVVCFLVLGRGAGMTGAQALVEQTQTDSLPPCQPPPPGTTNNSDDPLCGSATEVGSAQTGSGDAGFCGDVPVSSNGDSCSDYNCGPAPAVYGGNEAAIQQWLACYQAYTTGPGPDDSSDASSFAGGVAAGTGLAGGDTSGSADGSGNAGCDPNGGCAGQSDTQLVSNSSQQPVDVVTYCQGLVQQRSDTITSMNYLQQQQTQLQQQISNLQTRLANLSYYASYGTTLPGPGAQETQSQLATAQQQLSLAQSVLQQLPSLQQQIDSQYSAANCYQVLSGQQT